MDKARLRYLLGNVTPADADTQEHLDAACDHAIEYLPDVLAQAEGVPREKDRVYFIMKQLHAIRRAWLIANNAHRSMMAMG